MSAESPSRRTRCMPTVIPPQAVSDRSIIDSVTGFINEVALNSAGPQADAKEQIIWTRFETDADISDLSFGEDWDLEEGAAPPPLILTLGYGTGIQMWAIPANGEAIEVLSWRHGGPVKCLKILPTPLMEFGDQGTGPSVDIYHAKRPLIAIADTAGNIVNFVSLRDGDTVKSIKFKHPVVDILANRTTVVITFQERIAVFDARTFEDRCTVTTCFPSPGLNPNPVALGSRWMAFAELKMMPSKRSNGGCDGLVNTSTMASVISAAKTLGKGLKGIGETIGLSSSSATPGGGFAAGGGGSMNNVNMQYGGGGGGGGGAATGHHHPGLARTGSSGGLSPSGSSQAINSSDGRQPGIVTVMDIKYPIKDFSPTSGTPVSVKGTDPMVAHFVAHPDAIVNVAFDPSGMLLLTADKKGHDFNVFRIYPHPGGPSLAAVHHLYVLHRGDTTAKVQDICFSMDSRWVAVSSLRGTTHVFPITPYGGNVCLRTHGSTQVVNQLSRFHRSAGLSMDGRCSSPVTYSGDGGSYGSQSSLLGGLTGLGGGGAGSGGGGNGICGTTSGSGGGGGGGGGQNGHYQSLSNAYANPRVPPFAHPTMVLPLTQLRQPYAISNGQQTAQSPHVKDYLFNVTLGRQRHSSLSDDSMMGGGSQTNPLRVCATFARPRAWLLDPPGGVRDGPGARMNKSAMDSLFIMASHGALIQYDLEPKHSSAVVREKVCDDTPIELFVEAKAQWNLLRNEARFNEIQPPLPLDNLLLLDRLRTSKLSYGEEEAGAVSGSAEDDRWLSRVEIITHAGPHRRLWMGPQFIFKTYNTPSGSNLHHIEMESVEIGLTTGGAATLNGSGSGNRPARSNPMNMPGGERPIVPVFIESGSYSSYEQSPRFRSFEDMDDFHLEPRDSQLREDLADAMRDCSTGNNSGSSISASAMSSCMMNIMAAAAAAATGNASAANKALSVGALSMGTMSESANARPDSALSHASIENIVNPLGTVTTVVRTGAGGHADPMTDSFQSQDIAFPDQYIHENCDEALFRPVVTIIEQSMGRDQDMEPQRPPARMNTNLIVPVIMPTIPKAPQIVREEGIAKCIDGDQLEEIEVVAEELAPPKTVEVVLEEFPEAPVVVEVKQAKPQTNTVASSKQQKNKRNKEKTPPVQRQQQPQNVMTTSSSTTGSAEENTKAPPTKGNGSKGRKSSGQEPKAGKIRKSEKNTEITMNAEEEIKEVELPPPSPHIEEVEAVREQVGDFVEPTPAAEFDHLPEVETMPTKREMEIIQDSLMKETIVEAVTVTLSGGGGGGKKKKNRQKTPPKAVIPEPEPEKAIEEEEKLEMMVDISETKYELTECIEGATDADFDAMYSDPLVPLEPFDPSVTFEAVECPDEDFPEGEDTIHAESLMTFESPMEEAKREQKMERNEKLEKLHKVFTDRNLVFAMCTSWREASEESNNDTKMLAGDDAEESVNISSAPGWQLEIHEDYMDMEQSAKKLMIESMKMDVNKLSPVLTASTGSSEGEVSSSSNSDGKTTTSSGHTTTTATEDDEEEEEGRRKQRVEMMNDFDEELQPLIKDKEPMEQFDEDEAVEGGRNGDVEGGGGDQMPVSEAMTAATATVAPKSKESTPQPQDLIDGSGVLNCFRHLDRMGSGRSSTGGGSGRGSITSSVIGGAGGGVGSGIVIGGGVAEDMSSSSFSSTDAPSSPTASYSGENLLHFHGDSSGSL